MHFIVSNSFLSYPFIVSLLWNLVFVCLFYIVLSTFICIFYYFILHWRRLSGGLIQNICIVFFYFSLTFIIHVSLLHDFVFVKFFFIHVHFKLKVCFFLTLWTFVLDALRFDWIMWVSSALFRGMSSWLIPMRIQVFVLSLLLQVRIIIPGLAWPVHVLYFSSRKWTCFIFCWSRVSLTRCKRTGTLYSP